MKRWLLNLSVFSKILLPMVLVITTIVVTIAISFHGLKTLNQSATNIIDVDVKRSLLTMDMKAEVNNATVAALSSLLQTNTTDLKMVQERYQSSVTQVRKALEAGSAMATSPERRAAAEDLRAKLERYDSATRAAMNQILAGNREAGAEIFMNEARAARLAFGDAVEDRVGFNVKAMQASKEDMTSLLGTITLELVLLAAGMTVIALLVLYLIVSRLVTQPLSRLSTAVDQLTRGDTEIVVTDHERGDELGHIAQAILVFRQNAIERKEIEQSDRDRLATSEYRSKAVGELMSAFQNRAAAVLSEVKQAQTELEETARTLAGTAEQSQERVTTVASATQQATSNVESVASAAEELSASIREIGRQVEQSSRLSSTAAEEAKQTNTTVRGLAEASSRIGEVVDLINDIASQTNLLALNATIEAARAGEAGKGFAVVAGEVKHLANQTAKATEEIGSQISAVQTSTQQAVAAIGGIVARIDEINTIGSAIAEAVEQQAAATAEIARNVQQAAQGTNEVAAAISGVSTAATDTGTASTEVLGTTRTLATSSDTLRAELLTFLDDMRSTVSKVVKAS
ncbi:methyl-accepting chemotaxis protein [Magnetospirillum fulvum]|uniref:Methyl-accepting chemotaxis sensory transducer n=1 Tax=Magnetospirillum fulvum MGU-K5 TaxID=1316936 RepID=S9SD27_MAGFU|nr:methyl-accepting chemotaxis protein [Magnetospirillum fulvum]EPY02639.1 methyl-accepting chemotaxis sensory transducer [Magnetospirillum fulvum MGU-K5]